MALRTSKITSEIIQNCNKFFSHSTDATIKCKLPAVLGRSKNNQAFRYKITDTTKPKGSSEIVFQEEPSTLFAELQPAACPEFKFENPPPKWVEKSMDHNPFPSKIRTNRSTQNCTDRQKADEKLMKYKMSNFNPMIRNLSTAPARCYSSKSPADNSGKGSCKKKVKKCSQPRHRDCRVGVNKDCPRLKITNCAQSKGSNCKLNYLDPNCTKKFAPYPSYSESCAENLPDDPSECQQCPWRICDGADRIEPGKPVRNKRHYSTSCSTHLNATAGVVVGPLLPPPLAEVQKFLSKGKCGQIKKPCKRPPGQCEVRKQKEDEKRREKEIRIPPKPKKASEDVNRMVLNGVNDEGSQLNFPRLNTDGPPTENKNSWIDMIEGEEIFLNKKGKHPNCHKKKNPKRPKDSEVDQDLSIEYGNADWWTGRGKKTVVIGKRDPCDLNDCGTEKCRQTIRSKAEVTKKSWKKKDQVEDQVKNKTTPNIYRRK